MFSIAAEGKTTVNRQKGNLISEPIFELKSEVEDITKDYEDDLYVDDQYRHFQYVINEDRKEEGAPKALVFQGSYMNGMGYKFLENSFGEYISVHDYRNITYFDYYYNIFQPDCVIFELAEYTLEPVYFTQYDMEHIELNPNEQDIEEQAEVISESLNQEDVAVGRRGNLCDITVTGIDENATYVYMKMKGCTYDMRKNEDASYSVTIDSKNYWNDVEFITYQDGKITKYSLVQ